MAAKKPGAQATVTLKHLAANLAESHEMSKKQTEAVLGDLVGLVTKHLKKGDRIRIGGLGILQVRKRAARMGRNPATGEPIQIKASKKVAFRAAKELQGSRLSIRRRRSAHAGGRRSVLWYFACFATATAVAGVWGINKTVQDDIKSLLQTLREMPLGKRLEVLQKIGLPVKMKSDGTGLEVDHRIARQTPTPQRAPSHGESGATAYIAE